MKTSNRFVRGASVFKCGSCGRATRQTGRGDNENCGLCEQCFDLAGMENELSDCGSTNIPAVRELFADLKSKGIDANPLFPSLSELVNNNSALPGSTP